MGPPPLAAWNDRPRSPILDTAAREGRAVVSMREDWARVFCEPAS